MRTSRVTATVSPGQEGVEQADEVLARADDVAAGGQRCTVDGDAGDDVGRDRLVAVADRADREHVVVRALGVEDEEAVLALGQRHDDQVVAEAGVQPGRRADAAAVVGAVDRDAVRARPGPDPDAVGERARGRDLPGDAGRGEPDEEDLGGGVQRRVAGPCGGGHVGEQHRGVADRGVLVADEEGVPPGAEVEVEGALDQVEVAGEELRLLGEPDGGLRRHVDAVVAGAERHVGHRSGAAHVEHVAARPEGEVERLEAVVGDAVAAAAVGGRRGGAEGVEPDAHRVGRVGVDLAAEPDEVGAADQPDVDAVGALGGPGDTAGHRDARRRRRRSAGRGGAAGPGAPARRWCRRRR